MKKLGREKFFLFLLIILILINITLISFFFRKWLSHQRNPSPSLVSSPETSFYNSSCPPLKLVDLAGNQINLKDFQGQVILIYFSNFYSQDISTLIFLNHLWEKFKKDGLNLLVIFASEVIILDHIFRYNHWLFPIIKNDGSVLSSFRSKLNDLIIVNRDFKIKFKLNSPPNTIIYHQILRNLGLSSPKKLSLSEMEKILKSMSFFDLRTKETKRLTDEIKDKPSLIALFLSPCLGCPVARKIEIFNQAGQKMEKGELSIFYLFAKGNNYALIREYALKNNLFDHNNYVGIINGNQRLTDNDYLNLFDFETDPRLFLINRQGKIVFVENAIDQRSINLKYILEKLE